MSAHQTMYLVTSPWGGQKTFKLIPFSNQCPFNEGIFDIDTKVLVLFSNATKETFHMLPRLDENGDAMKTKTPRSNGKNYKEERKAVATFTEFYVPEKQEIIDIVKSLAVNAESFDYKKFMVDPQIVMPEEKKIEIVKA